MCCSWNALNDKSDVLCIPPCVCVQITFWLQQQGLPYLSTDLGSRLSEAEDLILEQQEFQSKVKVIRLGMGMC